MFFYSKGSTFNVVVSLDMLETGVLLLSQPAAGLNPEFARWNEWSGNVAQAMATGGMLHVTLEPEPGLAPPRWRGPLADAPEPWKGRAIAALAFFADRHGQRAESANTELIGIGVESEKAKK